MAGISSSSNRDQALEYQSLLHNLQNWEHSLLDKDNKFKSHSRGDSKEVASSSKSENESRNRGSIRGVQVAEVNKPTLLGSNDAQQYRFLGSDAIGHRLSSLLSDEGIPNANSEKELGNEYFKQKKFKESIDCYSRSIAFSPTAVAFANRAMAYLKIKGYEDAENDCTEALNLDDRYVKAYSRRATARKELGKLKASIEDAEFALRLEPNNQELKKQYAEVKAMYEKKIFEKASQEVKPSGGGIQVVEEKKHEVNRIVHEVPSVINSSQKLKRTAVEADKVKIVLNGSFKPHLNQSMQDLASRAASRASAGLKDLKAPKSAYQFEVSWRGFSDSPELQASLLKTIPPPTLPQLFKNALSAPLLVDIVKCISTFFITEMELAFNFLENLTSVPRFDIIIMSLSSKDEADLKNLWNSVFCKEAIPAKLSDTLNRLYPKYCP